MGDYAVAVTNVGGHGVVWAITDAEINNACRGLWRVTGRTTVATGATRSSVVRVTPNR